MNHEDKVFTIDNRDSNPHLHMLYVKWAVKHLVAIDKAIECLSDMHNLNLFDIIEAMQIQRDKLINENAAYADADEILNSIKGE